MHGDRTSLCDTALHTLQQTLGMLPWERKSTSAWPTCVPCSLSVHSACTGTHLRSHHPVHRPRIVLKTLPLIAAVHRRVRRYRYHVGKGSDLVLWGHLGELGASWGGLATSTWRGRRCSWGGLSPPLPVKHCCASRSNPATAPLLQALLMDNSTWRCNITR